MEWAATVSIEYTKSKIQRHSEIADKALQDVLMAIDLGMIPEKYMNKQDLVNIANVVLTGVNNTQDQEIFDLGMMIYNTISVPFTVELVPQPVGADNLRVEGLYIVPKQIKIELNQNGGQ